MSSWKRASGVIFNVGPFFSPIKFIFSCVDLSFKYNLEVFFIPRKFIFFYVDLSLKEDLEGWKCRIPLQIHTGIGTIAKSININTSVSANNLQRKKKGTDFLEHLEAYLAKRDGIDKVLKIARYFSKIILASSVVSKDALLAKRLKDFDASVGVSRKGFRLGKFIQDYNALKKVTLDSKEGILEIVSYGGHASPIIATNLLHPLAMFCHYARQSQTCML